MESCSCLLLSLIVASFLLGIDAKTQDWWQNTVVYQIYPRSFQDSDGDGVGDLNGIINKLYYLQQLGVGAIWLSPIFRSPMVDFGYDISDFRAIDQLFGTMDDFERLLKMTKQMGMKLLLDFVPNHSSDQHEWFQQSVKRKAPFTDYYVWRDGKPHGSHNGSHPDPPNNWLSHFGGSAWEWNAERKQFYLHQFAVQQPDLNYRNSRVVQEMKDVLKFWLQKGVDGFRVDAVFQLFEDSNFPDEPLSHNPKYSPSEYGYLSHTHTRDLNETIDMVKQWRSLLDQYKHDNDKITRLLLAEVYADIPTTMAYYGNSSNPGAHFPFNFQFITDLKKGAKAMDYSQLIHRWNDYMHNGRWPNWVLGNHDRSRVASRLGPQLVDAHHMLSMLLPGTAITYNGEELGMTDASLTWEQTVDPLARNAGKDLYRYYSRDPARTPFQWDSSTSAGFSSNQTTWLPVNSNYRELNVHKQESADNVKSHYHVYRRLVAMRRIEYTIQKGLLTVYVISDNVLTFSRSAQDKDTFVVVINLGGNIEHVNLKMFNLPKVVLVHTASSNSKYRMSDRIQTKKVELQPYASVVLTTGKVHEYMFISSGTRATLPTVVLLCTFLLTTLVNYKA